MTIRREKISDKCEGCGKVDGDYCSVYLFPNSKWGAGDCPVVTHLSREEGKEKKQ